jgi:hypothetical protein
MPTQLQAPVTCPRALGGFLIRREKWCLSLMGKLGLLILGACGCLVIWQGLYPFLAVSRPLKAEFLVVEGWLAADRLKLAATEFQSGGYTKLLTSGCIGRNEWAPQQRANYADWAASKLQRIGMPTNAIESVPCWVEKRDRTYHAALAIKRWFIEHRLETCSINVVTQGPHARRTRLLFRKALGPGFAVGVIALEDREYDSRRWWRSSEGVRDVLGEAIAYIYARFFFFPQGDDSLALSSRRPCVRTTVRTCIITPCHHPDASSAARDVALANANVQYTQREQFASGIANANGSILRPENCRSALRNQSKYHNLLMSNTLGSIFNLSRRISSVSFTVRREVSNAEGLLYLHTINVQHVCNTSVANRSLIEFVA